MPLLSRGRKLLHTQNDRFMRGIEFLSDIGYGDVLGGIFANIPLCGYDFYISEEEIHTSAALPAVGGKTDSSYFEKLKACIPYFVFFLNLQAYRRGDARQDIRDYRDFLASSCRFAVLVTDGDCFEIYASDEQLLLQFIKNAAALHATNIRIKTDYDDGRTRMSIR